MCSALGVTRQGYYAWRRRPPSARDERVRLGTDGEARYVNGAACLRRHAAEIGGGPSMGTMEAEQQHMYKVRMGSFPCAWSPAGADAMARLRSWLGSGFALPARTRESAESPRRRERRARKIRGEGLGVPARRLPRGLQGRRPLRGRRRPAGVVTNNSFMPTAWRGLGHLGHLGDVSCCKATMSRQENDAVALEVAHECRGAKRSSFCR